MGQPDSILVVGASGFVGYHLVRKLTAAGLKVIALARRPPTQAPGDIEWVIGDLAETPIYMSVLPKCRQVIHLASDSTPGSSAGRPFHEGVNNLLPTLALIEALQHYPDCRALYISSGGATYGDAGIEQTTENTALHPHSYYGAGKIAAEQFLMAYSRQFSAEVVILRPANIYGPNQQFRSGFGIIPTAMRCAANNETFHIWGDGEMVRDYLYIDDFISLCLSVTQMPRSAGTEIYNAGSGKGASINGILSLVENISHHPIKRQYAPGRKVDINHIVLNGEKALRKFGWKAQINLEDGLERTWQWFTSQQ